MYMRANCFRTASFGILFISRAYWVEFRSDDLNNTKMELLAKLRYGIINC
jgi:hypothetical protein